MIYIFMKYDKIQITYATVNKSGGSGVNALPFWKIVCNDEKTTGKISNFIETTKSFFPIFNSGATDLPPIGNSLKYKERSSGNIGNGVIVSFERTDFVQITKIYSIVIDFYRVILI